VPEARARRNGLLHQLERRGRLAGAHMQHGRVVEQLGRQRRGQDLRVLSRRGGVVLRRGFTQAAARRPHQRRPRPPQLQESVRGL